jgi:hypothetical protein
MGVVPNPEFMRINTNSLKISTQGGCHAIKKTSFLDCPTRMGGAS